MTTMSSKIRPLSDRVVVEPRGLETTSAGGIVIPDTADKDKPIQGTITAVGTDSKQVKVGDKVLFGKYSGTQIKLNAKEYLIMKEEEIMGVLED